MSKLLELADRIERAEEIVLDDRRILSKSETEMIVLCLRAGDALQSLKDTQSTGMRDQQT